MASPADSAFDFFNGSFNRLGFRLLQLIRLHIELVIQQNSCVKCGHYQVRLDAMAVVWDANPIPPFT